MVPVYLLVHDVGFGNTRALEHPAQKPVAETFRPVPRIEHEVGQNQSAGGCKMPPGQPPECQPVRKMIGAIERQHMAGFGPVQCDFPNGGIVDITPPDRGGSICLALACQQGPGVSGLASRQVHAGYLRHSKMLQPEQELVTASKAGVEND